MCLAFRLEGPICLRIYVRALHPLILTLFSFCPVLILWLSSVLFFHLSQPGILSLWTAIIVRRPWSQACYYAFASRIHLVFPQHQHRLQRFGRSRFSTLVQFLQNTWSLSFQRLAERRARRLVWAVWLSFSVLWALWASVSRATPLPESRAVFSCLE